MGYGGQQAARCRLLASVCYLCEAPLLGLVLLNPLSYPNFLLNPVRCWVHRFSLS
jgi:hypothetical protein